MLLTALLHTDGPCLRGLRTAHHLRKITARRVTAQNLIGYGMNRVYIASQILSSEDKLHKVHAHARDV